MALYLRRDKIVKAFAESKHPRYPGGSPKGGEFRPATSSASFIFMYEARRAENALLDGQPKPVADDERLFLKKQIQVDLAEKIINDEGLISIAKDLDIDATPREEAAKKVVERLSECW